MKKYQVKIDESILPQTYSFDQLIDVGLLDEVDENIKIKSDCDNTWITAHYYPFYNVERNVPTTSDRYESNPINTSSHLQVVDRHQFDTTIPQIPQMLNNWNWGAFTLSWLWAVCNNIYWPLIIIVFNFIPYAGVIISLSICIVLGIKGNQLAWNNATEKNVFAFEKEQASWNSVGQIFFIIGVLLVLTLSLLIIIFY